MKRIVSLSLILFILANATITPAQAIPKPVRVGFKLTSGLVCGVISGLSYMSANKWASETGDYVAGLAAPYICMATLLALTSGALSLVSFKSAYDDIKTQE